jgi:1-acyl-sn-glycerol-3-phosphate acyltransferase
MTTSLLQSRFSKFWAKGFEYVFRPLRGLHLNSIAVANFPHALKSQLPIILYGNHPSNWDGFLYREAQLHLRPDQPLFSLMLNSELIKRPLFQKLGGLGITPGNTSATRHCLRELIRLKKIHPQLILSVFPQGEVRPSWQGSLNFQAGMVTLAKVLSPVLLIPVAIHFEYLQGLKPTALMAFGKPVECLDVIPSISELESEVQKPLADLHALVKQFGEKLPTIWNTLPGTEVWKA